MGYSVDRDGFLHVLITLSNTTRIIRCMCRIILIVMVKQVLG